MIRVIVAKCNIRLKLTCKNILNPYNGIKSRRDKPCGVVEKNKELNIGKHAVGIAMSMF
jgi:hypothetical protein